MKCTKCGKEVSPNQTFCSNCGAPVNLQSSEGANSYNEKKGGVPVWLFIVVILLVVVIMLVAMFFMMKSNDSSDGKNEENEVSVVEDESYYSNNSISNNSISNSSTNSSSSNTSTVSQSSSSYYKVTVGDYILQVPEDLLYYTKVDDGETYLYVMDEEGTWLAEAAIQNGSYSTISGKKDELSALMLQSGMTVNSSAEKTINGIECLVFQVTYSGENCYIVYEKINSMTLGYFCLYGDDYATYNENALLEMITILSTAEQNVTTSTTRNLDTQDSMPKIDLSSILEEE